MGRPRFCYVVLCHTDADVVLRLVRRLHVLSPGCAVLVRHDREGFISEEDARAAGASLLRSGTRITWGGWSMTAATIEAFERARELFDADWYVLVSGQDYPIRHLAAWEDEVVASGAGALVDPMREPLHPPRYRFRWLEPFGAPRWVPSRVDDVIARAADRLPRPLTRGLRCYRNPRDRRWSVGVRRASLVLGRRPPVPVTKGAQWLTLSSGALEHVLARHRGDRRLRRFFSTTQLADEMYIPSVLRAAPGVVVLGQPTSSARFVGSSDSPTWVDVEELEAARRGPAAFVRKVPAGADDVREAADRLTAPSPGQGPGTPGKPGTPGTPATPPRFSVVVPAYQAERYVTATLESVQAQTVHDWECVVVDDGSADTTAGLVERVTAGDPRVRLVRQENRGLAGARNTGIRHTSPSAEYIAFLDADDTWEPDALERLAALLDQHPSAVGAYGYADLMDEAGEPRDIGLHPARQRRRRRLAGRVTTSVPERDPVRFEEWLVVGPLWPPAVGLHRRSVVDAVGRFDRDLAQLEDWDFYSRMSRHGEHLPLAERVAWYRQHAGQMTTRRAEFWYCHDLVRRKTWASALNTPRQRRSAVRVWRVVHARRVARCGVRLAGAVAGHRWPQAGRLALGLAVLLGQALRGRPPRPRIEHVRWTGRDV